jgi:CubicO group peptidase (beta-lactamase class C family)
MKKLIYYSFLLSIINFLACKEDNNSPTPPDASMYFPPINSSEWQTTTPESLGWETSKLPAFYDYLKNSNTKAFIVLKDGKIVLEQYFGKKANGIDNFDKDSYWYWASAAKTLTSFLVGKAKEEGFLRLEDKSSSYLGKGWTNLTAEQEDKITIKNQITMTTGLDDTVFDNDCTNPQCLKYLKEPNTRWAYHNAPYTLLDGVIEGATKMDFDDYYKTKLSDKIGINGIWDYNGFNHAHYSTARGMARFGLLILNKGKWENDVILADNQYYNEMISTSQNLNLSYGYLWWLNGKSSFMIPSLQTVFNGSISPNAPSDMFAAMGKNGQLINIVPSEKLVIVRMGDNPENSLVPFSYQNELWGRLKEIIQ